MVIDRYGTMLYLTFQFVNSEDDYVHVQSTHGDFHNFVKLSATMCDESVCCTTGVDW